MTQTVDGLVYSGWRRGRGPRGWRFGWTATEAASIAEVPLRTVQQWARDGVVNPGFYDPTIGVTKWVYCAWDAFVLRLAHHLSTVERLPRVPLSQVAWELQHPVCEYSGEVIVRRLEDLNEADPVLVVPTATRTVELSLAGMAREVLGRT
ncbi:MAG: hypothetical protein ACHQNA_12855, partial [Acidimicrobiales bacterium]